MRVLIPCLLLLILSAVVFLFASSTSKGLYYALIGVLAAVSYFLSQTEKRGGRAGRHRRRRRGFSFGARSFSFFLNQSKERV